MCAYFANMVFGVSAKCKLCNEVQHSRTHIFTNCEAILRCHSHFLQFSSKLVNIDSVNLIERAFGLKIEENDKKGTLRNYIHFSVRHIVFRHRHHSLSKNLLSTVRILIKKINCFIIMLRQIILQMTLKVIFSLIMSWALLLIIVSQ